LYEEAYKSIFEEVFGEDLVFAKIDQLTALFERENAQRNLFDQTTYDKSVAHANEFLSQRKAFLLSLEVTTHPPAGFDGFSTQKHIPTAMQACEYSKS